MTAELKKKKTELTISTRWTDTDNKPKFAREIVWYGRKGGKFLNDVK